MKKALIKNCLLILLCFVSTANLLAKSATFNFEFNGNQYSLTKGDKVQVGSGTLEDGSFAYIEKDEVIVQSENYTNNKGAASNKSTNFFTGEKEHLGAFYANKNMSIKKVKYYKKMDQYEIFLFTTDGLFTLHIEEAINSGELLGVNGAMFGNNIVSATSTPSTQKEEAIATDTQPGLEYILFLNDGSEIKCNLLEFVVNDYLKIETADKSIFVFQDEEVKELKKVNPSKFSSVNSSTANNAGFSINAPTVKVAKEKKPIGSFYNSTGLSFFIPNGNNKNDDFTTNVGGFSVNNHSGYQFKEYVFVGGGLGFNGFVSDNDENYFFPYFSLTQQVFALGNRKVSPLVILNQNFGSFITSVSHVEGIIQQFDFNFGIRLKLKKENYLNLALGYSTQLFNGDIPYFDGSGSYRSDVVANYFSVNLGYSFKK